MENSPSEANSSLVNILIPNSGETDEFIRIENSINAQVEVEINQVQIQMNVEVEPN